MKIFTLSINKPHHYDPIEYNHIIRAWEDQKIQQPMAVHSIKELVHVMESFEGEEFMVFTNFPPDSSYMNKSEPWTADSYDITMNAFRKLCNEHTLKAIHVITGAPENKVNEELLSTITSKFPITHQNIENWTDGFNFEFLRRCYMVNKIRQLKYL